MAVIQTTRKRFDSLQQEAYLSLWRSYDRLRAIEEALFSEWNITPQQYNILRLLEREGSEGVPSTSLAKKLVSRAPDVTRMLDKLEQSGMIIRSRREHDRRSVFVAITDDGIQLLDRLAKPLEQCHEKQIGHLDPEQLAQLIELLKKVREPHEPADSAWS